MDLKILGKKILSVVVAVGLVMPFSTNVSAKTELQFTGNETVFRLARDADAEGLSSLEGTKHWVKIFQTYGGNEKKVLFERDSVPNGTKAIAVKFEITSYDLDKEYEVSWGFGMTGDNGNGVSWDTQATGLKIDGNGTYIAVFDAEKALGSTISADGINSLEMPIQIADDEDSAKTKQICIAILGATCYTKDETVDVTSEKISSDTQMNTDDVPTVEPPAKKKTIGTLKLTSYKAGSKTIKGKTVKSGNVTVKIASKKYTAKANAKGVFMVKLKEKLAKKDKISVTVKKSGYKTAKKTFTVK